MLGDIIVWIVFQKEFFVDKEALKRWKAEKDIDNTRTRLQKMDLPDDISFGKMDLLIVLMNHPEQSLQLK